LRGRRPPRLTVEPSASLSTPPARPVAVTMGTDRPDLGPWQPGRSRTMLDSNPGQERGGVVLVRDVMTVDPITVTPDTGVKAALQRLSHVGITSLPVLDEQRRLCGIVSEADLIHEAVGTDPRAHERPITLQRLAPAHTRHNRLPMNIQPRHVLENCVHGNLPENRKASGGHKSKNILLRVLPTSGATIEGTAVCPGQTVERACCTTDYRPASRRQPSTTNLRDLKPIFIIQGAVFRHE